MIAAVSAILGVTGALLSLAIALWRTERRAGDLQARATGAEEKATSYATQLADMTNRFNEEKERSDRLTDANSQLLAEMAALPAAGSYGRLLSIISTATAARGDRPRDVPAATGTDAGLSTKLLVPGEDP